MASFATLDQWIFGLLLILSSLGMLLTSKPVQASLCFLLTLLSLAALYLELSAQFIASMQILIYAGAILVIFIFVIVLFQDVHQQIHIYRAKSKTAIVGAAAGTFIAAFLLVGFHLSSLQTKPQALSQEFGSVHSLGRLLYLDFFFPFEAVILIFLVAVVGAVYIGRKER